MPNPFFKFKQFTIWHDKCAMKVGTDGTLLGAWAKTYPNDQVLDIGTGSGIIALMIAQRSQHAQIDAVEIDPDAYKQATENIAQSPFAHQVSTYHDSFQSFAAKTTYLYDLIISNPPFFADSLKCADPKKTLARHDASFSYNELMKISSSLLAPNGRMALVLPYQQKKEIVALGERFQLSCNRLTHVFPKKNVLPKRILIEFSRQETSACELTNLILENQRHERSAEYQELTQAFYLR